MKYQFVMLFIFAMICVVSSKKRRKNITPLRIEKWFNSGKYKKIGDALRIHPDMIRPGADDPVDNMNMLDDNFELDILLTSKQKLEKEQNQNYSVSFGEKWNTDKIPYYILESSFNSSKDLETVKEAIKLFNNGVKVIQFRPWRSKDEDCVIFYYGSRASSNLGYVGGLQSISVTTSDEIIPLRVVHFMMHTMGFIHETNRPERDEFVKIRFDKIPEALHSTVYKTDPKTYPYLGPWDIHSLMQLPPKFQGLRVYDILDASVDEDEIGVYHMWTDVDKQKIDKRYG